MILQVAVNRAVSAVAPIDGISFGNPNDKTTWRIDFQTAATPQQRAAGQAAVDAFLLPWPGDDANDKETEATAALAGDLGGADMLKLFKAKFVSDLAFRLGKAPVALTPAEISAERVRIAAIYKAL